MKWQKGRPDKSCWIVTLDGGEKGEDPEAGYFDARDGRVWIYSDEYCAWCYKKWRRGWYLVLENPGTSLALANPTEAIRRGNESDPLDD